MPTDALHRLNLEGMDKNIADAAWRDSSPMPQGEGFAGAVGHGNMPDATLIGLREAPQTIPGVVPDSGIA